MAVSVRDLKSIISEGGSQVGGRQLSCLLDKVHRSIRGNRNGKVPQPLAEMILGSKVVSARGCHSQSGRRRELRRERVAKRGGNDDSHWYGRFRR